MFRWTPYIFLRWVFFLMLGILLTLFYPSVSSSMLYVGGLAWLMYVLCWFTFSGKQFRQYASLFGFLAALLLMAVGSLRTSQHTAQNDPSHFIHQDSIEAYQGKIISEIQPRAKSWRAQIEVEKVYAKGTWKSGTGKIMAYFSKAPEDENPPKGLDYAALVLVRAAPQKLTAPKNPEGFDYQAYLFYQNIYHQHFIKPTQYLCLARDVSFVESVWAVSYYLRAKGLAILKKHLPESTRFATASALLLGVKDYLEDELRAAYAGSGLMHLLAVSGLHVGLVMLMLRWLLGPIRKIRFGRYIFLCLVIALLVLYAFVTGLSPSVLRAVLMFSLVLGAETFERRGLIYNNISISAFILLFFNPFLLVSVSFQLSYLAVLGIVYLQPKIYAWFSPKAYLLDKAWQLTSVSIAAQIGTAPLAIYYFHQFPNYFILANLLVLPAATYLLGLGVCLLLLDFIPYLGSILGVLFYYFIGLVNGVATGIQALPGSVSLGWYISKLEVFLLYVFILFFLLLWAKRRLYYLGLSLLMFLFFQLSYAYRYFESSWQKELVIFHVPRQAHFNLIWGQESYFFAQNEELLTDENTIDFNLAPYWLNRKITEIHSATFEAEVPKLPAGYRATKKWSTLRVEGKLFLFLHQRMYASEIKVLESVRPDYVILQNNAVSDVSALSAHLHIPYLVLDASNGWVLVQRLAKEASEQKIACWSVAQKGAFRIDLQRMQVYP